MSPCHQSLIEHGLVPNAALLRLNSSVRVPPSFELAAPWNLPSRLFQFPLRLTNDGVEMSTPDLAEHPFVRHVSRLLNQGLETQISAAHATSMWWHAVDLAIAGRFDDLIRTRDFTTDYHIAGAISFCLQHGGDDENVAALSTRKARTMMRELGFDEPGDRQSFIRNLSKPAMLKPDVGTQRCPIANPGLKAPDFAWALIHGIEDGHFTTRVKGDLQWSTTGRDFHAGVSFGLLL